MKKPSINLSKESISDFFLNHGEKFVVGIVAALACGLVWGGIDAVRTKPAKPEQRPKVIVDKADQAMKHIGESKGPPAETAKRPSIATQVEPWKEKFVATPTVVTEFNAPVTEEKVKRSQPEVLALADVIVRPGWAVLAVPPPTPEEIAAKQAEEEANDKKKQKQKQKEQKELAGKKKSKFSAPGSNPLGGAEGSPSTMMGSMTGMVAGPVADAKLVPYCLVMALVPVTRQQEAFRKAAQGFLMDGDTPHWSDYRLERAEVPARGVADADLQWAKVDLDEQVKLSEEWLGFQPDIAPPDLVLDPNWQIQPLGPESARIMPYVLPLPQLAGEPWGVESLHPWVVEQMRKRQILEDRLAEMTRDEVEKSRRPNLLAPGTTGGASPGMPPMGGGRSMMPPMGGAGGRSMMPPMGGAGGRSMMPPMGGAGGRSMMPPMGGRSMMPPGGPPGGGSGDDGGMQGINLGGRVPPTGAGGGGPPGMGAPGMANPGSMATMMSQMSGGQGMGTGMGMMAGQAMQEPEYRMFRFIDTTVEPGKTYRYRIRVAVRNPNYSLPGEYLLEPELAKSSFLLAPWSEPSAPTHVSDKHRFLVRSLKRGEQRKSKTGFEVLVLAENPANGNYTMRTLQAELGGLLNLEKRPVRGADPKTSENVVTNTLLLDARGRQDEPEPKKGATARPSEPVELLFLREDGSFDVVTAQDSLRDFEAYAATLAAPEGAKKDEGEGGSTLFGGGTGGAFLGGPGGPAGRASSPPGSGGPPAGGPGGRISAPPGGPPTGAGGR